MRSKQIKRRAGISRVLKTRRQFGEYFFHASVFVVIILLFIGGWNILRPGVRVRVSPDTVAAFRVPHRAVPILREYSHRHGISFPELFAVFNAENNFFPEKYVFDLSVIEELYVMDFQQLLRRYNVRSLAPYIELYRNLFEEIEVFPIAQGWYLYGDGQSPVMFGNSWGVQHNFQGNRMHMGAAIIDRENIRGRVPVISMTRGTVQDAGWCNQLGYFVGIVTINGTYYLYAHLDSISQDIAVGQHITAGSAIGQMGNTGGGRRGRSFPVHLHLAIRPEVQFTRGEFWINPYVLLRYLEAALS